MSDSDVTVAVTEPRGPLSPSVVETASQTGKWVRVAVGRFGGSCGHCVFCQVGDVVHCAERKVPGLSYPGG